MSRRARPDAAPEEILGRAYEERLDPGARRSRGTHFTPRELAAVVIDRALDALGTRGSRLDEVVARSRGA